MPHQNGAPGAALPLPTIDEAFEQTEAVVRALLELNNSPTAGEAAESAAFECMEDAEAVIAALNRQGFSIVRTAPKPIVLSFRDLSPEQLDAFRRDWNTWRATDCAPIFLAGLQP